jgi:hypothetical protein
MLLSLSGILMPHEILTHKNSSAVYSHTALSISTGAANVYGPDAPFSIRSSTFWVRNSARELKMTSGQGIVLFHEKHSVWDATTWNLIFFIWSHTPSFVCQIFMEDVEDSICIPWQPTFPVIIQKDPLKCVTYHMQTICMPQPFTKTVDLKLHERF